MARLQNYNGRYCESEYENAFLSFLEEEDWQYLAGNSLVRDSKRDVLYADDLEQFLSKTNPDLLAEEVRQIMDTVRLAGAESDFATLHKIYGWMTGGIQFTPQTGIARMVALIDFDDPDNNIFRAVNQFTVEYTNNGQVENRRPDILLFVNGLPLCIIELKNPADINATIYDAWEQINTRYWRDIPHLLHYCPLACISDGVKTRLGTVRTPYEHFYAWRRVNDGDKVSTLPFDEVQTMIKGVYSPTRFLEIFRDYIYFQDSEYDSDEVEIVCRYPQFFAARLLKQSIVKSVIEKSGKGGTYFGATGCGKTYTMAFLARQLALRCTDVPEIGSPTIVMIVDRDDLQKQGAKLFTKSMEFLNLGEVSVVPNRNKLREELGARESGGFYICTIQKFCDREDDKIGLINSRANIICFSDEAHRTQLDHSKKIQFSKDADDNMRAMVSKPYAKVLREAFPHATFVGFTGTPISETYQTFGEEIDRYTMDQAVADGLTVSIKYHPRIAKVLLDQEKVKQIEAYYRQCAEDGATAEDIEASKVDNIIIGVMRIQCAVGQPVTFQKTDYIRVGSYTKKLKDYPALQSRLWLRLHNTNTETMMARKDLSLSEALRLIDYSVYFDLIGTPQPVSNDGIAHYMVEEGILIQQENGLYAISNLGAILFAKRLLDFPNVSRKAIRVVQYKTNNRMEMLKEEVGGKGYVVGFEGLLKYIEALIPTQEIITGALREKKSAYPLLAVREAAANALIHQDFSVSGAGPTIEIFSNRIEITNPGTPLVDISRIIDNPPKSRNEKLASLMRRMRMCEELGTGWDKIVLSCELLQLPAPKIELYEESTRVTLFSEMPFSGLSAEDKLRACYMHACVLYVQGEQLTNSSLRERFGVPQTSSGSISRLIKEAVNNNLIKPFDPETSNKYKKYVPIWA